MAVLATLRKGNTFSGSPLTKQIEGLKQAVTYYSTQTAQWEGKALPFGIAETNRTPITNWKGSLDKSVIAEDIQREYLRRVFEYALNPRNTHIWMVTAFELVNNPLTATLSKLPYYMEGDFVEH